MSKSKRKNSKPKQERMFLLPHSLRQDILQLLLKVGKNLHRRMSGFMDKADDVEMPCRRHHFSLGGHSL